MMEHSERSRLVDVCCAILLVVAAVRLFQVDRQLLAHINAAEARFSFVPPDSSLKNLVPEQTIASTKGTNYLLLFVVHNGTAEGDVEFWNAVSNQIERGSLDVQMVGVCDEGTACKRIQEQASFRLVGFLDPYQSHILATVDAGGNAVLYRNGSLAAQLQRNQDPDALAAAIAKAVK